MNRTIKGAEPLRKFDIYRANEVKISKDRIRKVTIMVENRTPYQYRHKLNEVIEEYADVFALSEDQMTVNNFYTQKLRTIDDSPTYIEHRTLRKRRSENKWKS